MAFQFSTFEGKAMTDYDKGYRAGIEAAIAALPVESIPTMDQPWSAAWNACRSDAMSRLQALLHDPAEELAEKWLNSNPLEGVIFKPVEFARFILAHPEIVKGLR